MKKTDKTIYRKKLIEKIEGLVEQQEVTIGAVKTSYLLAGKGECVIFLHGAGAGAVTWYPTIGDIAKRFKVIVPDIVGYGESDKPDASYDRPYFSNWLKDFLNELKISKSHIVGLSQGGAIALQFTIENPQMVNKLVLVDSGGLGAKLSFGPLATMIWMNSFPSLMANRLNSPYILHRPKKRDPNHSLYSVAVLKGEGGQNAFKQGRGSAVSKISEELLRQIQNKTLIIWGKNDKLFALEYGEAAARIIPNAKFQVIQNAGHLPQIDQPELFNEILANFLNNT